jgi:ubiquinone/menaquinone biosynthesis C-methylase UbiE
MTQLYTTYADLYHKMYQSFIDYDQEYAFYRDLVINAGGHSVLEIGCGTGQVAKRFISEGYDYTGIDISNEMLNIARETLPAEHFHLMDMREIALDKQFDVVLITARSISYLITNTDVLSAFRSIQKVCKPGGFLIFDFIDAKTFIPQIQKGDTVVHEVTIEGEKYKRESIYTLQIVNNWLWTWQSTFLKEVNGTFTLIGKDDATLRAFTADEISILLALTGFVLNDLIDRKVYAFDTKVVIAQVNALH